MLNAMTRCALCALVFLAAAPAALAQGKKCATPGFVGLKPVASTRTLPPYPQMSVITNESGTTLLEVEIGPEGTALTAEVVNSSGSLRLDEAAAEHVKSVWRWIPAMQDCKPMNVRTRVSVAWDLKDAPDTDSPRPPLIILGRADYPPGALTRREQGDLIVMFILTANGRVERAKIHTSSNFAELDDQALSLITTRYRWVPATMDGKPVNSPMLVAVSWKLD